ncbi:MAG TPA: hypothetical protein VFW75_08800 [Acetobacteraceae bacterium]|nr:hypothetical protein [Acetobacteraceae bacterium]
MPRLTFARATLWIACIGGLIASGLRELPTWLPSLATVTAYLKDEVSIWHNIAPFLVGVGAIFGARAHAVDRRLNGTWYWMSKSEQKDQSFSIARGRIDIIDISDHKKRASNPGNVIFGATEAMSGSSLHGQNSFHATDIGLGSKGSNAIYYGWKYINSNAATGLTRIDYGTAPPDKPKRFSFLSRQRQRLHLTGKFLLDADARSGTIFYYRDKKEAENAHKCELEELNGQECHPDIGRLLRPSAEPLRDKLTSASFPN